MKELNLFIPITKVDEEKRLVYGIATAQQPDQSGEICDYTSTVPYYKAWSERISNVTDGKSKGNLRSMHDSIAAGKITQINFNDAAKQIEICGKVVDDKEWNKVLEGVYTGFSQGGRYIKTWKVDGVTHYTADPSEVSLVDNPCLSSATFTILRNNGSAEMRKFKSITEPKIMIKDAVSQVWQAIDGTTHATKAEALKKNAELDANAAAQPAIDAADKINNILNKSEKEKEEKQAEVPVTVEEEVKNAEKIDLKKYDGCEVFDVATALNALCSIQLLLGNEIREMGGEEGQIADLKMVIDRLKSFIASEIMESDEDDTADMAMAASDALGKKGAALSGATKGHVEKMMKSMMDHSETMQECYKAMGMGGDMEEAAKSAPPVELEKISHLEQDNLALKNTINNLNSTMEKMLSRVVQLESQPMPAKGKLFHVEKGHEVATGSKPVETITQSFNMPSHMSPETYRKQFNL